MSEVNIEVREIFACVIGSSFSYCFFVIFVFHLFREAGCEQFKWPSGPSVANNFDLKLCSTSLGSEWRAGVMVSSNVAQSVQNAAARLRGPADATTSHQLFVVCTGCP